MNLKYATWINTERVSIKNTPHNNGINNSFLTIKAITDKNSVFVKGKTTKEQIEFALTEGKKRGDNPHFIFEIGSNFFMEIAKIKAFRVLWKSEKGKDALFY